LFQSPLFIRPRKGTSPATEFPFFSYLPEKGVFQSPFYWRKKKVLLRQQSFPFSPTYQKKGCFNPLLLAQKKGTTPATEFPFFFKGN